MKCPKCDVDLVAAKRDGIEVEVCPTCQGMWLTRQDLEHLEDEAFHLGDREKGSLVFSSTPTDLKCPECGEPMRRFAYRLYDLDLEFCAAGHGFWLDADEDKRVLDLMKEEQARVKRSTSAEHHWASLLRHLRSGSLLEKLRDLLR
jgi:Zn-finger nucleic acid-binding protein